MFSINRTLSVGVLFVLSIGMVGCTGGTLSGLSSVKPPEHANILAEYKDFVAQYVYFETSMGAGAAAANEYVTRGYDLADRSCVIYFAKLKELRNETTFASDTLVTLFAAGGVIAGLSGAASPALVAIFAATGLVPNSIKNFNSIYLLAEVGDDLYPAISQAMASFRLAHPADGSAPVASKSGDPLDTTLQPTKWTAQQLVQQYASLCSLPAMTATVVNGVSNLQWKLDVNGTVTVSKAPPAAK